MTRTCTVCAHRDRHSVDKALLSGATFRDIAKRYGLSLAALFRHRSDHLPAALVAAAGAEATRQALDVLAQLKAINAAALAVLKDAKDAGDGDLVLRAVDRVYRQIELQAKLLGDLQQEGTTTVNVVQSPEWQTLRAQIVAALAPFPEARLALAAVVGDGTPA